MIKIILIGNLTADPDSRYVDTANGQQMVTNFSIAVNRYVKGEKKADYFRISCWGRQAENAEKYLSRGSKVCVIAGQINARTYTTRSGSIAVSMEVIADELEFLSSRSEEQQEINKQPGLSNPEAMTQKGDGFTHIPDGVDEELPFN